MKAIITKYHGPGNVRGSRYSASDGNHNRITLHADDSLDSDGNHNAAAIALCVKMGWTDSPLMSGTLGAGSRVYVFDQHANRVRFTDEQISEGLRQHQAKMLAWQKRHQIA